jgi:hypothetical protein
MIKQLWPYYGEGPLDVWKGSYKKYELVEVIDLKGEK